MEEARTQGRITGSWIRRKRDLRQSPQSPSPSPSTPRLGEGVGPHPRPGLTSPRPALEQCRRKQTIGLDSQHGFTFQIRSRSIAPFLFHSWRIKFPGRHCSSLCFSSISELPLPRSLQNFLNLPVAECVQVLVVVRLVPLAKALVASDFFEFCFAPCTILFRLVEW